MSAAHGHGESLRSLLSSRRARRFAKIYKRLGNKDTCRKGICKQDPYFQISAKVLQINKNPELFSNFGLFLVPNHLLSQGNVPFPSAFISGTPAYY